MLCGSEHHIRHIETHCGRQPYKSEFPGTVGHPVQVRELLEVQRHDLTPCCLDSQGCSKHASW